MAKKKNIRDVSKLSGKPLSQTLAPSPVLNTATEPWVTSRDLVEDELPFIPKVVHEMTYFLLVNPNLFSSWLFRADILYDSEGSLCNLHGKEEQQQDQSPTTFSPPTTKGDAGCGAASSHVNPLPAGEVEGFVLMRTVVRRLIPRKSNLDRPLEQTCHFYEANSTQDGASVRRFLAVYTPHVSSKEDTPFYHPLLRSFAFLYDFRAALAGIGEAEAEAGADAAAGAAATTGTGRMSLHILLYPDEAVQTRLERTLHMILHVQTRIARGTRLTETLEVANHNPIKDNVIPQHLVQNTYARLKIKYASDLCNNWVESTEPSKHVFEDLAVAAFLIELWRNMYKCVPGDERAQTEKETIIRTTDGSGFPGFVDVACGNGLLVYVLLQEGYQGWGFDARRRKTWSIFPSAVQDRLKEKIYIPKPFAEELALSSPIPGEDQLDLGTVVGTHTGIFPKGTFIISNHADELTLWTPLMAMLLDPASPSPFLAIPCCSHALSGARYRYPPSSSSSTKNKPLATSPEPTAEDQPVTGDLKALREAKQNAIDLDSAGFTKSMYGALTAKVVSVAEELGYDVEKTLLRIPSTRNVGVIGGRRRTTEEWAVRSSSDRLSPHPVVSDEEECESTVAKAMEVVRRECLREGGVGLAARTWVERAKGLHQGQGMGKQQGH